MKIDLLPLDDSLPTNDQFYTSNTGGSIRFITAQDEHALPALSRVTGDLAHRDNILVVKLNEVIDAINQDRVDDPTVLPDPIQPSSPANKAYVDRRDTEISRGIAIVGERLRALVAMTTLQSDWKEVQWKDPSRKERITLRLSDLNGAPVTGLDFDQVVSISLFLRAEVSDGSTVEYIYRAVTFGQTTGFKMDDIWLTPPNTISVLIPYTSAFASYPPASGYLMTQPNSIAVKAVVVTTQPSGTLAEDVEIPTLDVSDPAIAAIVNLTLDTLAERINPILSLAPTTTQDFMRVTLHGPDNQLMTTSGVLANRDTLKFPLLPTTTNPLRLIGVDPSGIMALHSGNTDLQAANPLPLRVTATGAYVIDHGEVSPYHVQDATIPPDQAQPILHRAIEYGVSSQPSANISKLTLNPATVTTVPSWATMVKLQFELGSHTQNYNSAPSPHGIKVVEGSGAVLTTTTVLAQALVSWDYGGGVRMSGIDGSPYQQLVTVERWVTMTNGRVNLSILNFLHGKTDATFAPWNLVVIRILKFGR